MRGRDLFVIEMLVIDFEALMLHSGSSQGWSAAKRHHSLALTRDGTCLQAAGAGRGNWYVSHVLRGRDLLIDML